MKKLTHRDYCEYYARHCKICKGAKRVQINGVWTACVCQNTATLKYRFEQFEVSPADLKYKTWNDFTGVDGNNVLTRNSFIRAKSKALEYCFGSPDLKLTQDRKKNLVVQNHCHDGQNVIIAGGQGTGKTLVAALIIKEVAHACRIHNLNIGFKCIKSVFLQDAARWDSQSKSIDQVSLDDWSEVDFLVIDEVDLDSWGHTTPPDLISLNVLFSTRTIRGLPTIVICSDDFWRGIKTYRRIDDIFNRWGRDFVSMLRNPSNMVIELEMEASRVG